jgi:3-oxoacyl-[acyl-carrier-protein] synthase II
MTAPSLATRTTQRPHIAGIGAVSAYGWGTASLFEGLLSQKSAVHLHEVPELDRYVLLGRVPADGGSEQDAPSRFGQALFAAAREAVADARSGEWVPGARVGLVLGTTIGEAELRRRLYFELGGRTRPRTYLSVLPSTAPSMLMKALGFQGGPVMNLQAACASFNTALLTAKMMLDQGLADDVIVAGCDFPNLPEEVHHFEVMRAVVTDGDPLQGCRPFQQGSRGFVTSEGAAAVILTRHDCESYGELLGGALNHDPFHPISVNPDRSVLSAMYEAALRTAAVAGDQIDYFNTHGAGTAQGDATEIAMHARHFPDAAMFSVKPLLGHAHAAAGGLELAVTLLAWRYRALPAAPRVAELSPGVDPTRLRNGVSAYDGGITFKVSMGMGGYNAAVIVRQDPLST